MAADLVTPFIEALDGIDRAIARAKFITQVPRGYWAKDDDRFMTDKEFAAAYASVVSRMLP